MKKETAVEWLVDEMIQRKFFEKETELSYTTLEHLTNQAKEMEKQQIFESWDSGFDNGNYYGKYNENCEINSAEQYYNETFKQ